MLLSGRRPRTKDERMIANNFEAMSVVRTHSSDPLTPEFVLEVHRVLTADTLEPADVGRLRRADEPVTVQDHATGEIVHVPPDASELPWRLEALCAFANASEDDVFIHPIVRAVLLHFMLAYDHPFVDGNGRTARALFYWSLLRQKYGIAEFLSISRVIQKAPAKYGRAFIHSETDRFDATYFVLHQLDVINEAISDLYKYLEKKAREVRAIEKLLHDSAGLNHRQRLLLAHALRHPNATYTIDAYRREHGVVYQTARTDLLSLADAGLLKKKEVGRKLVFTVAPALLKRQD